MVEDQGEGSDELPLGLGLFETFDTPRAPGGRGLDAYARGLELGQRAEQFGFDTVWVTEHHFRPGASLPSPPVLLSALASRTRRIRLGPLVAVLPLHDPVLLAEEYALLDVLSGGRLELGVGPGYVREEFEALGLRLEERSLRFDSMLPRFVNALSGTLDPMRFPDGRVVGPRGPQRPHPPIWRAAARPESVRRAGIAGDGLGLIPYAGLDRLDRLPEAIAPYRDALPSGATARVLVALHVYIGPHLEEARSAARRFLASRPVPSPPTGATRRPDPGRSEADALAANGLFLFGDEAEVAERLRTLVEWGVTDLAAMIDFGGLPDECVEETLEALPRCAGRPRTVPAAARAGSEVGAPGADAGHPRRAGALGNLPVPMGP